MSWFDPKPRDLSLRLPRQLPRSIYPSYINDLGQRLNLLMHEGDGGRAKDSSGYGSDGIRSLPTWADGRWGWCLDFNGVNDTLNCGSDPSIDDVNDFTWEFWMYWRSVPVLPDIYSFVMSKGVQKFIGLYVNLGHYAGVDCATTAALRTTPNGTIPLNTWVMVDMTYDGSATKTIHINQNAVEVLGGITTLGVGAEVSDAASNLVFGFIVQDYYDGLLALPKLYARVLSATKMTDHFERTRGLFGV